MAGSTALAPGARMRRALTAVCLGAGLAAACGGGGSPAGPTTGGDGSVLEGRAVNAVDGGAAGGVTVAVGSNTVTADADGVFRVNVSGPSTHSLLINGASIVERQTSVVGPGSEPARVSLIPSTFDVTAFEQMFRPSGALQRWTMRPSLVVLGNVMTYQVSARDEYSATSTRLSNDVVAELVAHLTEGLAILTAGTYTAFASVDVEYPAANSRVMVQRSGQIVVGRYNRVRALSNTIGYGQWALDADGSVWGGSMFLDNEFDREDSRRRLLRIHELGHALGLMHVTNRASVMNPSIGPEVTAFDRSAASIAFQRPIGNRAPDADPSGSPAQRSSVAGVLTWGPRVE